MYSRFSKKEIVALGLTSATTLCMASVLFFANASTPSTEDFMTDLENTFQAPTSTTTTKPVTTGDASGSSNSSSSSSKSTANSSPKGNTGIIPVTASKPVTANVTTIPVTSGGMATEKPSPVITLGNAPSDGLSETASGTTASSASAKDSATASTSNTTPALNSAKQCNLPAIDILQTEELDTKTVVRWRDVPGAIAYDVMKRSKSGEFVMIERVKTPIYTAHLARGSVKYEDFKVAAVCGDTESPSVNTSKVTSVKTGPVQTLAILIISLFASAAIVLRKKFAKN